MYESLIFYNKSKHIKNTLVIIVCSHLLLFFYLIFPKILVFQKYYEIFSYLKDYNLHKNKLLRLFI